MYNLGKYKKYPGYLMISVNMSSRPGHGCPVLTIETAFTSIALRRHSWKVFSGSRLDESPVFDAAHTDERVRYVLDFPCLTTQHDYFQTVVLVLMDV